MMRHSLKRCHGAFAPRLPAATAGVTAAFCHRGFASTTNSAPRAMETWEEVELHRPRAPTLEGYVRPVGAPNQSDITRDQYHQFMLGKPAKYSVELRNFLMGLGVVSFCLAEFAFTVYKLKPDDLDWVDEERQRAAAAKARIEAKIQAQEAK
mmetsp:Transcript_103284/g.205286  ORF Transcript_103284/g.205286 Transcript_103284/m.205286 type:complete len:152 (-) Transcript_103284:46-501(-)|eukprot:CAMPEP_0172700776 /NCGR_PEP_ID=MMETSP1074-20121228/31148_1 /TAXON_ID=2916 /ORGANISM="Ceratium fusus, Strain PA161109" /LENGTH=151 /DNA_ID=CAMNT_0013522213 /DNA_START=43 /DNA_END=498 /DNA_ORIENTATION=-